MLEALENAGRLPPGRFDELVGDAVAAGAGDREAGSEAGGRQEASAEPGGGRWGRSPTPGRFSPSKSPAPSG